MADFYSQVVNFASAVQAGIDPRTGLYSVSSSLANLVGNNNLGPGLNLALSYGPLSRSDHGFGTGCSLGLPHYDTSTGLLTLSTGERYIVGETADSVTLKQQKLNQVIFRKSATQYEIVYSSGTVEVLTGPNNGCAVKVPIRIYSPAGRQLDLSWGFNAGPIPRLLEVRDETDVLLRVAYSSAGVTLTVWPEQAEAHAIFLQVQNGYLTKVKNLAGASPLVTAFDYTRLNDRLLITGMTTPTGLKERVIYKAQGHRFPASAGLSPLPYVTSHTIDPRAGQPAITTTYTYSDYNYLGAGTNYDWSSDSDYLYNILTTYSYSSKATRKSAGVTIATERVYNQFHLLTQESVTQGECSRTTETSYYAVVGRPFDEQPPQFLLSQKNSVFHARGDVEEAPEVTETQYDDNGNLTFLKSPDGTLRRMTYYPADGLAGLCPADPNGFVRLPHTDQLTPPEVSGYPAADRTTVFTYRALPAAVRPASPVSTLIVPLHETAKLGDATISKRAVIYIDEPSSAEHGRIKRITNTLYTIEATPRSFSRLVDFTFDVEGDVLDQVVKFKGHDGLTTTSGRRQSRFSGRVWSTTDVQGNDVRYAYDSFGCLATQTSNPGSDYERIADYSYQLMARGDGASSVTATDPAGSKLRTWHDALGRMVEQETMDCDADVSGWRRIQKDRYDSFGRLGSSTSYDVLRDGSAQGQTLAVTSTLHYDDWGRPHRNVFDDGREERADYDPITRRLETGLSSSAGETLGVQVIIHDVRGLPTEIIRYDNQSTERSRVSREYDGLGRLRKTIDALNQVTSYDYDHWNRVTSTVLPGDEQTTITRRYANHTSAPLTSGIAVDDVALGTQTFDSLHRLTKTTSGGRTSRFTYEGAMPAPTGIQLPGGQTIAQSYIPELGNVLKDSRVGDITQSFSYDPLSGALTAMTESHAMARSASYYPSGLLQTEVFDATATGGSTKTAEHVHSLCGRPQSYTDITGTTQTFIYDSQGRPQSINDADVSVALSLDGIGRLTDWTTTDVSTNETLSTKLSFDDQNREIERDITGSHADGLTIAREYLANDLMSRRLTVSGDQTLRDEAFAYDGRSRLSLYTCAGTAPPRDDHGKGIRRQKYTYDKLDNITTVNTKFSDNTSDVATFTYSNGSDPTQLSSVEHTHRAYPQKVTLAYDPAGRMTRDELGRTLGYDGLGRLASVTHGRDLESEYLYDAQDRLVGQRVRDAGVRDLYYRGSLLTNEIHRDDNTAIRYLQAADGCVARQSSGAGADATALIGVDMNGSVVLSSKDDETSHYSYAPYGYRKPSADDAAALGYNGERLDPVTGASHLGNGYRAYNPALMRFTAPDSMSPFGAGGINPYAYCVGDPVNRVDPSGHLSLGAWIGIGLGVVGIVLTAGAALGAIAAAGSIAAAIEGASVISLVTGASQVVGDVSIILSGALEDVSPKASEIFGLISTAASLGTQSAARVALSTSTKAALKIASASEEGTLRGPGGSSGQMEVDPSVIVNDDFAIFRGNADPTVPRPIVFSGHSGVGIRSVPTSTPIKLYGPRGKYLATGPMGIRAAAADVAIVAETIEKGGTLENYWLKFSVEGDAEDRGRLRTSADYQRLAERSGSDIIIVRPGRRADVAKLLRTVEHDGYQHTELRAIMCRGTVANDIRYTRRMDRVPPQLRHNINMKANWAMVLEEKGLTFMTDHL